MLEHNNRKKAKQFAEYITGKELRQYVADKVSKYISIENPTIFDGAVGSGQLEQYVNHKFLYGCEIQKEACDTCKKNYKDSDIQNISFFNYSNNIITDCVIMNPPFSLKFKDLTDEEKINIQQEFTWKKSGVVDDIFVLKSLKYTRRYGFYILFPGVTYRNTEKAFRSLIGTQLKEFNVIRNAFDDTQIDVVFLVIDKEKDDERVYRELYDCKIKKVIINNECKVSENGDSWELIKEEVEVEVIDIDEVTKNVNDMLIKHIDKSLTTNLICCSLGQEMDFLKLLDDIRIVLNKAEIEYKELRQCK